jgi:NAD(P)-dependent dehydrogenase (short-subunit alcohol dehydrogenase family)
VVVNNAGGGLLATVDSLASEQWDDLFALDLKAAWILTQAALPGMRSIGGGAIVNVASIHAHMTRRGTFPYAAAKAGMLGLTCARNSRNEPTTSTPPAPPTATSCR